jgi:hypothetical protein
VTNLSLSLSLYISNTSLGIQFAYIFSNITNRLSLNTLTIYTNYRHFIRASHLDLKSKK